MLAVAERPELRERSDDDVLEAATAEHRAVVSENARHFASLHRRRIDEGRTHYGIVLISSRRFPRRKGLHRPLVSALRSLLLAHSTDDSLKDQLIWLA